MLGRIVLYGLIALLLSPIVLNVIFYFVEKEKEANPEMKTESTAVVFGDAKSLYAARCASCHGANGDGIGGYPRVNGEGAHAIASKLIGYKNGSYGFSSKGVMRLQVQHMSEEEIRSVAAYLSGLTPVLDDNKTGPDFDEIELDYYDISS